MRVVLLGQTDHRLTRAARNALAMVGLTDVVEMNGGPLTTIPEADVLLSAAYTRILPDELLRSVKYPINVHPSLLPDYRGSHPVFWALYEGRDRIGATVHLMTEEVDAGPVIEQESIRVDAADDPEMVYDGVTRLASTLLTRTLETLLAGGELEVAEQVGEGCYRASPAKEVDRLEFTWDLPSTEIIRRVRIFPSHVWFDDRGERRRVTQARQTRRSSKPAGTRLFRGWKMREYVAGDGVAVRVRTY